MDYFPEKEDTKRRSRNLSEKKRRDQFNVLITELGNMVSPATHRKMDKTSLLRCTIAFLKEHNEAAVQSRVNEIQEEWKPSFLSNEEFTHLMLEALDGFIIAVDTEGQIHYVSESVASLLGHVPTDLTKTTIYDITLEDDKKMLYGLLQSYNDNDDQRKELVLHFRRSAIVYQEESYELVKLNGHFRRLNRSDSPSRPGSVTDDDQDSVSIKSGQYKTSRESNNVTSGHHNQTDEIGTTYFIATARLQTAQLIRELPIVVTSKHEFTSRYSLEWKFLFLDHRAPPIIGFLPFELLGTSGYDYYHPDDLERVTRCHEALMQTGEGTSCCHRFFTKGQHWIWLQTRYFITYHQWNSKPEFVVATHRVLAIADVINLLKKERDQQQTIAKASSDPENDDIAEKTTDDDDNPLNRKEEKKLNVNICPESPSWSSKSSLCCSSSTRVSQDQSSCRLSGYSDTARSDITNNAGEHGQHRHHHRRHHQQRQANSTTNPDEPKSDIKSDDVIMRRPPKHETLSDESSEIILGTTKPVLRIESDQQQQIHSVTSQQQQQLAPIMPPPQQQQTCVIPPEIAMPPPASVLLQPNHLMTSNSSQQVRSKIYLTQAQAVLQEQLRMKHADLSRRIVQQQEELKKISDQLLMSQFGLVSSPNPASTFISGVDTIPDFQPRETTSTFAQQSPSTSTSLYGQNHKQI